MDAAAEHAPLVGNNESFPYPVLVSRESFQSAVGPEGFSPDEFLYQHHRFSSVDSLIKDLTKLSKELNQELLDLVNSNFNDFVKLGKSIQGSMDLVSSVQQELAGFKGELLGARARLIASGDIVTNALHHKQQLLQLKTRVRLVILLHDHVSSFEQLLNVEVPASELVEKLRTLTTLYLSFCKLYDLLAGAQDAAHVVDRSLKPRVMLLKFEYKAYLDEVLAAANKDRVTCADVVLELMNIYKITGHEQDFVKAVRS